MRNPNAKGSVCTAARTMLVYLLSLAMIVTGLPVQALAEGLEELPDASPIVSQEPADAQEDPVESDVPEVEAANEQEGSAEETAIEPAEAAAEGSDADADEADVEASPEADLETDSEATDNEEDILTEQAGEAALGTFVDVFASTAHAEDIQSDANNTLLMTLVGKSVGVGVTVDKDHGIYWYALVYTIL